MQLRAIPCAIQGYMCIEERLLNSPEKTKVFSDSMTLREDVVIVLFDIDLH